MADLPVSRVELSGCKFKYTCVDIFGTMVTKARYRGGRREKRYGVLFTCLQTRAVHIQLAYSQSTDSFLKAFSRFISRRSKPLQMFSDCGTNFVGAAKELQDTIRRWTKDPKFRRDLIDEGVVWNFNQPLAPHMGGVWESLVNLAKRAVFATMKGAELTDEELVTVLTECEGMLNNLPLTYITNDSEDLDPLTPAHFLNNKCTKLLSEDDTEFSHTCLKKRWLYCQKVLNQM